MKTGIDNLEPKDNIILVVDDDETYARSVESYLQLEGYRVITAADGQAALEVITQSPPDLVLLDAQMPRMSGFDVCRRLKENERTRLIPVVMVTALRSSKDKIRGIEAGADDFISKPFVPEEMKARLRSLLRMKHLNDQLESAESIILSLAHAIEAKDSYTEGHTERVGDYSIALGTALHLSKEDLQALSMGGVLHDIGKIGVLDSILNKEGRLTVDEYELMKQHPLIGHKIIQPLKSFARVVPIVRHHHERFDGKGYPDSLKGEEIPLLARITTVADVYDALTSDRPYRKAMSPPIVQETMLAMSRTHLDPELVRIFLGLMEEEKREK